MSDNETGVTPTFTTSDQVVVWQTLASKRASIDTMMWQTPALGMTAQAFLLTLALGPESSQWARLLSSFLSLALSIMVMQLMAKHRRHEMLDSLLLQRIEVSVGISRLLGTSPHASPGQRPDDDRQLVSQRLRRSLPGPAPFWSMSSYELWMIGLSLFAIVAFAIFVAALIGADASILGAK